MPDRLHLENFGPIHALPVLHYRMEFAHLVREAVAALKPDGIALELPATLETPFLRGVRRLPELSVLSYPSGEQTTYLIIEPADPLVEGARLALELGIPLHLVDADLDAYPAHDNCPTPMPCSASDWSPITARSPACTAIRQPPRKTCSGSAS